MTRQTLLYRLAAPALAVLALSACATPFKADVARFQQLPAPQGQSFTIQSDNPRLAGGLEFATYADIVAQRLTQQGYTRAADPGSAQLVVRLDYSVDNGREKVQSTGFGRGYDPFWGPGFGRGWYGRGYYGWRSPYVYGFYDPFLFGPGYDDVTSYTVYTSQLQMRIDGIGNGQRLFEGRAQAQSLSNKLTYLVPNLIDAMFQNFPGRSGEEIRVTIAPEPKGRGT